MGRLYEAAQHSHPRTIVRRLSSNGRWVVQATLATALGWTAASQLFGHPQPIFAPVAALIAVSATLGQRRRYAVEMVVGIALGIGIADVLFELIGRGTAQMAAIVAGAMVAAVALGGGHVVVTEAAVSALLVVTVQPPESGLSGARFLDSLLGGAIALIITSLLPSDPALTARRTVAPILAEIAAALEDAARALERGDRSLSQLALARARSVDSTAFSRAVIAGRETLQLAPLGRGTRARFARYARAEAPVDAAISSVESLSRAVVRALRLGDNVPPPVPDAIRDLASAARRLEEHLDDEAPNTSVREPALRATATATQVLEQTANLSISAIVVQVRSAAVDLLRASGEMQEHAERLVRETLV